MEDNIKYFGEVIFFDIKKGYGFLSWQKDGNKQKDIFCHFSDVAVEGFKALYKDQKVEFQIGLNKRNETKAVNIVIIK